MSKTCWGCDTGEAVGYDEQGHSLCAACFERTGAKRRHHDVRDADVYFEAWPPHGPSRSPEQREAILRLLQATAEGLSS